MAGAARRVGAATHFVMALPVSVVLGAVLLAQWIVVGVIAAITPHNGDYYYTGGDATWYYTSAWVLGHGHIPQGYISYGYALLLAPIAHFAGPSMLAGLPYVIGLNLLVLWPIALLCVYGIAKMIGGRGFAYVASFAWTAFPLASIPYFYERYHERYVDHALPPALGLVATGDFPAMVFLLVAAYFSLKALSERSPAAALVAGLAAGFAATVKPSNLIFLPAPLAALVVARRGKALAIFGAALVPSLAGLALWKYSGLGHIPAISSGATATLASGTLTPLPVGGLQIGHYLRVDWGQIWQNMLQIREYTWSLRMVTWAVVAGVIALFRRSTAVGLVLGGWLAAFIVLKSGAAGVNVVSGSFFRYMVPVFPAFFFGLVSIALLVPVWGRRLANAGAAERFWPVSSRAWSILLGVAAAATVLPIVAVAAFSPLTAPAAADVESVDQYVPADSFPLATRELGDGSVVLSWPDQNSQGTRVVYGIFREPKDELTCSPVPHAATHCVFFSDPILQTLTPQFWTRATTFRDHPSPGRWVYRIVATADPDGPVPFGDFMVISRPARVSVSAY